MQGISHSEINNQKAEHQCLSTTHAKIMLHNEEAVLSITGHIVSQIPVMNVRQELYTLFTNIFRQHLKHIHPGITS
jgi:hypothetical protein